jgi:methylthioribulose-1-phosphate dehydratase
MRNSYRAEHSELAEGLARVGREFYARGWAMGTSGNFSAVVSRDPLRLAITSSGIDKGSLSGTNIIEVDSEGLAVDGKSRPSDETLLHITVARARGAGAVLHTHSVWSTLLSEEFAADRGLAIEGYEMLKGLDGVRTHEHREWLPILDNSQDMRGLAREVERRLAEHPGSHAFLLRGHGLYTWGRDLPEARRHVEILEFLMEVIARAGKIRT